MMVLLRLFYEFFKTGLFSVGGGMATIPFLQHMGLCPHKDTLGEWSRSYTSAPTPTSSQVPLCSAHTLQLSVTALLSREALNGVS